MDGQLPVFVEGTIVGGPKAGFRVRVEDDDPNTGGYLIISWDDTEPDAGGDDWVEHYDQLSVFFEMHAWKIKWDSPIEKLRGARDQTSQPKDDAGSARRDA